MSPEEKYHKFFADIAWGARSLSGCENPKGATLSKETELLSYGFNKKIATYETSAIYDAIFAARATGIKGASIFSTYFPTLDDVKLIVATGISSIYFFGEITDMSAVQLLNSLPAPLEITKLNLIPKLLEPKELDK